MYASLRSSSSPRTSSKRESPIVGYLERETRLQYASSYMSDLRQGGCLCGTIRYQVMGDPALEGAGYCHCRKCQRSTGAPLVAWVTYPKAAVTVLQGVPKKYHSSTKAVREFCSECGTQLFFSYTEGPADIDISIASFDDPSTIIPAYHIWTSSQIPWLAIADTLPRFVDDGNDFSPYT